MGSTDGSLAGLRRSLYFPGCMSPSCVPVHEVYSRIPLPIGNNASRSRMWKRFVKMLVREGRSIYGSKPQTFQYDAISYSQNFDDGCRREEYGGGRRPQVLIKEFTWHVDE